MAVNWNDYQPTDWSPGMPITETRMDHLEQGVTDNRDDVQELNNILNGTEGLTNKVNAINDKIGTNEVSNYDNKTLWQAISTLYNTIENATTGSTAGTNAWAQIVGLIGQDTLGNLKQSLSEYMAQYSTEDTNIKKTLGVVTTGGTESYAYDTTNTVYKAIKALNDALGYDAGGNPVFGTKDAENNIITVLSVMNELSQNVSTVLDALDEAAPYPTYSSLANRLAIMNTAINNAITALELARQSSVYTTTTDNVEGPTTYGSLDERLEHIETELVNNVGNINDGLSGKISTDVIENNLNTLDTTQGHVLDARQGRVIKELLYKATDTAFTTSDTVASRIKGVNDRVDTLNTQLGTNNYGTNNTITDDINSRIKKTDIYNDLDYVPAQGATDDKVLDARQGKALKDSIDTLDSALNTANTGLVARVGAAEDAIDTLNGTASTAGSVLNTVNTQIAAVVANAPEAFDTLVEIADWIGDHSDTALEMQQDISDNASAIATIQSDLNTATTGIKARVTTVENTVNDPATGLAATKAIADAAAVATTVNSALDGLDARLDAIDGGSALSTTNGTLDARVTTLETQPKSATIVLDNITYDENTGAPTNVSNPTTDADYLLKNGDKYYYWKYIQTSTSPATYEWALISGGAGTGTGNTSGMDLTAAEYEELDNYAENTDYYVTRADGVHHYRYIPDDVTGTTLVEIEIGVASNYNIGIGTVVAATEGEEDKTYLYLYKFNPNENAVIGDDEAMPLNRGTLVRRIELPATGGGGISEYVRIAPASGQNTVLTAVASDALTMPLSLDVFKRDATGYIASTVDISIQYREKNTGTWRTYTAGAKEVSVTSEGPTTFTTTDIASLLVLNKTIEIKITATDKNNEELSPSSITFSITKVALNLTSTFNQSIPCTTNTVAFNYSYTGSGLSKTLYMYLDDDTDPIYTHALGTGIGNGSYNINMSEYEAGTYNLKVYFETEDHNRSNVLNYFIMYVPSSETLTHPIIGISIPDTTITEGDVFTINYSTYTQNAETTESAVFEIFEQGASEAYTSKSATNIENNRYEPVLFLDYPTPEEGVNSITFTIRATASNAGQTPYSVEQTITVNRYTDTSINFNPIESNLIYEFDPINHTNNDSNRAEFTYSPGAGTTYTTTLEDFNWTSNGYLGNEALTFNGEAKMYINVPVLITNVTGTDASDSPTDNGRTIEFEYEVSSVTDINAPIISYFNNSNTVVGTDTNTKTGVGFEITPQNCYLISESKSIVTDKKGFIHNEDDIAAAYLSEGSCLRVSFVIEAKGTHETGAGDKIQTVNIYINGQYANSCPYDGNSETFTVPADANCKIIIGNDSSILKLYDVRIYNRSLDESEILQNYTTAPLLRRDKLARIIDNDLLTTGENPEIDYYKARQSYNCLLITGNLSQAKSVKVSSGLIFTQPNSESEDGYDIKFDCMKKFTDGSYTSQNAVQGTSSVKFPVKNYKVYLTDGFEEVEGEEKAKKFKYALAEGRTKESTFCWKGDYMSSDHANTFNANWADALESRIDGNSHVQNSVFGFRCLLFYRENENENTPIVLIGDGTLNNDKGNTATFQLEDKNNDSGNNTRSQKWEFKNNTKTPCLFQSDILEVLNSGTIDYTAARDAFESTYPDEGDLDKAGIIPNYNHLQILLSWVFRRANYWDETNPTLRATKKDIFKNEFSRHFNMQHMLLYYLFCEFTAMTDNRAKNMFIRCDTVKDEEILDVNGDTLFSGNTEPAVNSDWYKYITGDNSYKAAHYSDIDWNGSTFGVWTPILYDLDSCYGVENSGYLQVPYYAQWNYRDVADTKYLFNGYESRLWLMFEDSFADEIREMAQTIYVNGANGEPGLNYNSFYQYHITDNTALFPPVIINQDMNKKYLNPWINGLPDPEDETKTVYNSQYKYLQRGSRTDQKVGFIERRARMLYSKYLTTQFISNEASINFRCGNAGADDPITLTASTACYPAIQFSDTSTTTVSTQQQYANTGESVEFTPDEPMGFSDTIYIRGASMLTGIEGIGGYMPYEINLSGGRNLKQLILGSSTIVNTQASSLSNLGACSILEDLNVENFNGTSFTSLDLSSNKLLKNLYATGADNLGTCSFANGGIIEKIELGTGLTNLTLRNQTRINTLKFGGSNIIIANNVSKINTIFIENVSNAAMSIVQDILKLRLFALRDQLINGRASSEPVALGGGIRINGLNMTLDCTTNETYLLDLLIDASAMAGKGLTHDGTLSNSAYPYLSGTLTITRGQDKKIAILRSMYPNLTIVENNSIVSHIVTYKYDDYYDSDNNLVSGNTITTLFVNDGATAPDIYSNGTLSEMPHRDPTVRVSYEFGSIDTLTNNYIPYSGWQLSGSSTSLYEAGGAPIIRSNTVIETHFETLARTYYVKWFMNEDSSSLVKTSTAPVEYGGGYNLEAPTVAEIHAAGQDTCTIRLNNGQAEYSIFKGWQKLPTNITPSASDETYNIYASYDSGTVVIDDLFNVNNLDNLTPVQLLVLSALDSDAKTTYQIGNKIAAGTRVTYTMGQDSIASGITLINEPLRLDSNSVSPQVTTIQPLKSGNDAFTLVIDYCFNPNATYNSSTSFATLASVYYGPISTTGVRSGLGLFYGLDSTIYGPRVGFGDMYSQSNQSVLVGNTTNIGQRNIVVLRHPAGSDTLYIYSGLNSNITTPTEVQVNTLSWANNNSNAYLNFGQLSAESYDGADDIPNSVEKAQGTIFWSKYWAEDLGAGECKRLAAWPHETITFAVSQLKDSSTSTARVSSTATISPSVYLSALTSSSHIKVVQSQQRGITNFSARDYSVARTLCNQRIFAGLPTTIQAIMCQPSIPYTYVIYTNDQNTGVSYNLNTTSGLIGKDYVFQYSAGNLTNKNSTYITREDKNFSWLDATQITAYTYSSSSGWVQNSNDNSSYYLNIRCPFKAITWSGTNKMRVFRETTTSVPSSIQIASSISNNTGELRSGDIYIDSANKTYVYVLNSEIISLGIQIMPTTGDYAKFSTNSLTNSSLRGGWVRAEDYWTRSAIAGTNGENFAYTNEYGDVETATVNSASATGLNVMYTISI